MIASLFGAIRTLKLDQLVIDVNGVGYLVHITPNLAWGEMFKSIPRWWFGKIQ